MKHIHVDYEDSLQAEKIRIVANGLRPNTVYKFYMRVTHAHGAHHSFAAFCSNGDGYIDVKEDEPVRGTYSGVDPMGLFISLMPHPDFAFGGYLKITPPVPFYYDLELYDEAEEKIDSIVLKKHWMHPLIERTEVEYDGFCGTLFKPPGEGPFPIIIDLTGTGGGLNEHRGSMLANEGFVVMSLAYFDYKNLVPRLEQVDIEYFKKPIDYLLNLPYTNDMLGISGISFGATLVDVITTRYPQFKAVVIINGPQGQCSYMYVRENGKPMELVHIDDTRWYFLNGILATQLCHKSMSEFLNEKNETQWERIPKHTNFRIVGAMDDLCSPSIHSSRYRARRLRETGHNVEVELVNGGHIVEPPYFPHHELVYAKFQAFYVGYGGEVTLHCKGQETIWWNTIDFFNRKLGKPPRIQDWERQTNIVKPSLEQIRAKL